MRQAVTTMVVGISLSLLSLAARAGGRQSESTASIAQARRLIEAKDHAAAMVVLEDMLIEAETKDKPEILDLLRKTYTVLARQAQAAGRERDAAHYRDNLDILDGGRSRQARSESRQQIGKLTPVLRAGLNPPSGERVKAAPRGKDERKRSPAEASTRGPELDLAPAPAAETATLSEPPGAPAPVPLRSPPPQSTSPDSPAPGPREKPPSPASGNLRPAVDAVRNDEAVAAPPRPTASSTNGPTTGATPAAQPRRALAEPTPEQADRLFSMRKYTEAGRCYAALARENRLPDNRQNHWAYCRMVDVAMRMNAQPRSASEWDEIEAEIQGIQQLAPKLWYAEYLRNKLAEVRQGKRRSRAGSDNLVVRGSTPDENQNDSKSQPRRFSKLFGRSNADAPAKPSITPAPGSPAAKSSADQADPAANSPGTESPAQAASSPQVDASQRRPDPGGARAVAGSQPAVDPDIIRTGNASSASQSVPWQVHETTNFRIFHCDAHLAESVGEAAELVRAQQAKRWTSPAAQRPWTPRCEVYLYPTGKEFAAGTGQPEHAPGFSTMFTSGNRVTGRRTSLRADHPQLLTAVLPHEVTHVVIADLFTAQQIPRWADEGIAVLAEPSAEQNLRAAELQEALASGQVFDVSKLMSMMDYPDAKDWSLYYAQSISLTRFLVEQGSPERFLKFVRDLPRTGAEAGLRDSYGISGFAELQNRWRDFARQQLADLRPPRPAPEAQASAADLR
jgi:hypothetical protein